MGKEHSELRLFKAPIDGRWYGVTLCADGTTIRDRYPLPEIDALLRQERKNTLANYDSSSDLHIIEGYETPAISAVKDLISETVYDKASLDEQGSVENGIEIADLIANTLLRAGILIPKNLDKKNWVEALKEEERS